MIRKLVSFNSYRPIRFQSAQFTLKDRPVRITLFSRRCNRRLGTRMWRRGANLEGATANFVETEQLVEYEDLTSSFIQLRGSIPLLWEQIVDLSYKPRLSIIEHEETHKVVQRHFHDLSQRYGKIIVADLTDKAKGDWTKIGGRGLIPCFLPLIVLTYIGRIHDLIPSPKEPIERLWTLHNLILLNIMGK